MGASNTKQLKIKFRNEHAFIVYLSDAGNSIVHNIKSHPDNPGNTRKVISGSNFYYEYTGDLYDYNNDFINAVRVIEEFNPKKQGHTISMLVTQLELECNMRKYESLWANITAWVSRASPRTALDLLKWVNPIEWLYWICPGEGEVKAITENKTSKGKRNVFGF